MSKIELISTREEISSIVSGTGTERGAVIPILQAIQEKYNYLPEDALRKVSEISEITLEQLLGVASFYSQFRLEPVGEHMVKVCMGTACHVKGSALVYDAMRRELKLEAHADTDSTGKYTLEKVNCLGCCTLAPVVQIDHITYGHVASDKVGDIIGDFDNDFLWFFHKVSFPVIHFSEDNGSIIDINVSALNLFEISEKKALAGTIFSLFIPLGLEGSFDKSKEKFIVKAKDKKAIEDSSRSKQLLDFSWSVL